MMDTQPSACQTIRIVIADDRPPARSAMRALLAALESEMHPCCPDTATSANSQPTDSFSSTQSTPPHIFVVAEACQGAQAVALVEQFHPDVVLIDARMPVMDGMQATRQIKARWPTVRVLMLSMYSNYKLDAYQAGADVFLLKGCSPEELLEAIITSE